MVGKLAKETVNGVYNTIKNSISLTADAKAQLNALREEKRIKRLGEALAQQIINSEEKKNIVPFAPKPLAPKPARVD